MFRLNLILLSIAIICALSVVTTQHKGRKLFIEMEKEKQIEKRLNVEWGRLQLEQATWAAHSRVEDVATSKLGMMQPDNKHKRVVLPEGVFMPQVPHETAAAPKKPRPAAPRASIPAASAVNRGTP